jgi:AcrR family transcriptional regulator
LNAKGGVTMPTRTTKQILGQTLKTMMQTTSLDHITIDKLAEAAHINRNTFYYHFDDIHSLLDWVYQQDVIVALRRESSIDHWQEAYQLMLTYIATNRQFCQNTFRSLSRSALDDVLYHYAGEMVTGVVDSIDPFTPPLLREAIKNFYGHAIAAQVTQWLENDLQESQASMIHKASVMLDGTFAHIIKQGKKDRFYGDR